MFDDYLYYVRVYDPDETYNYEYGNEKHATEHYETEISKGNKASLFRYKDGVLECIKR